MGVKLPYLGGECGVEQVGAESELEVRAPELMPAPDVGDVVHSAEIDHHKDLGEVPGCKGVVG